MKFRLVEYLNDNIWYHISPDIFDSFTINRQGVHLAETIKGAQLVAFNQRDQKYKSGIGFLYTVKFKTPLNALQIDLDPGDWTGVDLAKLFKAKLNNQPVEGSRGADTHILYDENGNELESDNYYYDLSPDLIKLDISKLSQDDINTINKIADKNKYKLNNESGEPIEIFKEITDILTNQGYNAIIYPLAEDPSGKINSLLIWKPDILEIINRKKINIDEI